jgi:hypothetical protein
MMLNKIPLWTRIAVTVVDAAAIAISLYYVKLGAWPEGFGIACLLLVALLAWAL